MIAVVDACYFFRREKIDQKITKILIPSSIEREMLAEETKDHFYTYKYMIEIRDPTDEFTNFVRNKIKDRHFGLSNPDIDVVALTLELQNELSNVWIDPSNFKEIEEVVCLTTDNGIKNALKLFDLGNEALERREFRLRCYACFSMFKEHVDFCKKCGLSTITRVSVLIDENNNEKVLLKKKYSFRPKVLVDERGVELRSADQREYIQHKTKLNRNKKSKEYSLPSMLGDI
ncbi:RNA-binding protein NOB1 [Nosema granulosis]|uniref:RNA-binding protein NOB1 n=1 Tax=Nosema granulosis TaxID=83296 RepID=A0A9P6KZU5_9MICR|nr:RNA-binding protein NOB1 [Nosema granulosis]